MSMTPTLMLPPHHWQNCATLVLYVHCLLVVCLVGMLGLSVVHVLSFVRGVLGLRASEPAFEACACC